MGFEIRSIFTFDDFYQAAIEVVFIGSASNRCRISIVVIGVVHRFSAGNVGTNVVVLNYIVGG